MMRFSDEEIIRELHGRLRARDEANEALSDMAGKLRALNDKLIESEKLKTHFLSNTRNEINNPMTSVLTSCETILSDGGPRDYETLRSIIGMIYKEAFNLNFQLGNIFFAAELEAGDSVMSISSVDVAAALLSLAESFQQKAADARVKVTVDLSALDGNRSFTTDAGKLRCIAANLLSNAIEFGAGQPVEIKAWKASTGLNITVKDRGRWIGGSDRGAIFERFKRLESGSANTHAGHSLGLSVVKALLDVLGGTITVASCEGEGAEFKVAIPEAVEKRPSGAFSSEGNDFFEGEEF